MNKEITKKIRKLLALSKSDNEHEARLATERASRLLTKYNLTPDDVEQSEIENTLYHRFNSNRIPFEYRVVMSILREHFFVKPYINRIYGTSIHIIGRDHNIEVAKYVFDYLLTSFRSCYREFKKNTNLKPDKKSYLMGVYDTIMDSLERAKSDIQGETGLVLSIDKDLETKALSLGLKTRTSSPASVSRGHFNAGRADGRNIHIRSAVSTSQKSNAVRLTK